VYRRPVAGGELRGVLATVAGLAGLLLLAGSTAPARSLDRAGTLGVGAVTAVVLGLLMAYAGLAAGGPLRRGLSYAAASGVSSGVASALTQTITVLFGQTGWGGRLSLPAVLVAVFAPTGLLLAQAAYRYGLGAPLAVVIIANPAAAGAIGILRLGERFTAGVPGIALAGGCALLLGYGVTVLATHAPADHPPRAAGPG